MRTIDHAGWHEGRLLAASRPGFPALLTLGRFIRSMQWIPGLGWVVSDPVVIRRILDDRDHFTIIGEGVVGQVWAQVLGDWVNDMLDGRGHEALRATTRGLLTGDHAESLVSRAAGPRLRHCSAELAAGGTVDIADLSRVIVGRIVADTLGLRRANDHRSAGDDGNGDDAGYREIYRAGEELAALALNSTGSTVLAPAKVAAAKAIVTGMTGDVAAAWRQAPADTVLGRCRELGLGLRETEGLATLLIVAGTQTTVSAMTRTVALLHDTGEQHRLRAQPERIDAAVREGLRVASPVPVISRSVIAETEIEGQPLQVGQRLLLLTRTANNVPGRFDLDRENAQDNRQLWFGAGRHFCLGASVGRAEVTSLLAALLATNQPWRIVERRYGHRTLIPTYARLRVTLA
jgi:cytochrome P450